MSRNNRTAIWSDMAYQLAPRARSTHGVTGVGRGSLPTCAHRSPRRPTDGIRPARPRPSLWWPARKSRRWPHHLKGFGRLVPGDPEPPLIVAVATLSLAPGWVAAVAAERAVKAVRGRSGSRTRWNGHTVPGF